VLALSLPEEVKRKMTIPDGLKNPPTITCRFCGQRHGERYLCDPIQEMVNVILTAAEEKDMTAQEFMSQEQHPVQTDLLGEGTIMARQIVIAGAVVPMSVHNRPMTPFPALVFTGQDANGEKLPQWVFVASPYELRKIRDLCDHMTEMAIRRAREGK
jgi:hypothetical protein